MPSKEKFYSSLTDRIISDKEYKRVLNVWNKFEMEMMKDYIGLYLKCGVLLLADMFEKYRNNSLKNYELCPSHYLSAPGLSWDAMLKITKMKLDFILYPDMYIIFEKGAKSGFFDMSN